eukprot:2630003-Rhodomonas_salina.1
MQSLCDDKSASFISAAVGRCFPRLWRLSGSIASRFISSRVLGLCNSATQRTKFKSDSAVSTACAQLTRAFSQPYAVVAPASQCEATHHGSHAAQPHHPAPPLLADSLASQQRPASPAGQPSSTPQPPSLPDALPPHSALALASFRRAR